MRRRPRRPRFPGRHADRRRQVALLPGPGRPPRRHHRRRLAAHRPDEGPGGRPARLRRRRPSSSTARCRAGERFAYRDGPAPGRGPPAVRLARTAGADRLLPRCCSRSTSAPSPSTRPTASATGATIFARNTASSTASREFFPDASVHAYTATATEQVRRDIIAPARPARPGRPGRQLRPAQPHLPRAAAARPVEAGPAKCSTATPARRGIIYCLRRRDVDELAAALQKHGVKAVPYHAGLTPEQRQAGAGSVRRASSATWSWPRSPSAWASTAPTSASCCTPAMPKSLEHYQQETGRAGRDGLEAECVLLYSGGDFLTLASRSWRSRRQEAGADPAFLADALQHLDDMDRYCPRRRLPAPGPGGVLRPGTTTAESCGACDLCLGDTEEVAGRRRSSRRRSCRAWPASRRASASATSSACCAARTPRTSASAATTSSRTYGLLKEHSKADVRDWIYQLIGQGVLVQVGDEYPLLKLNDGVVGGDARPAAGAADAAGAPQEGRDGRRSRRRTRCRGRAWIRGLFEALRELRRRAGRGAAGAAVHRSSATRRCASWRRVRPSTPERMRLISGVGDAKLRDFAGRFLPLIADHCREYGLALDVTTRPTPIARRGAASGGEDDGCACRRPTTSTARAPPSTT